LDSLEKERKWPLSFLPSLSPFPWHIFVEVDVYICLGTVHGGLISLISLEVYRYVQKMHALIRGKFLIWRLHVTWISVKICQQLCLLNQKCIVVSSFFFMEDDAGMGLSPSFGSHVGCFP